MHITGLGDLGSYNRDEATANGILYGQGGVDTLPRQALSSSMSSPQR